MTSNVDDYQSNHFVLSSGSYTAPLQTATVILSFDVISYCKLHKLIFKFKKQKSMKRLLLPILFSFVKIKYGEL